MPAGRARVTTSPLAADRAAPHTGAALVTFAADADSSAANGLATWANVAISGLAVAAALGAGYLARTRRLQLLSVTQAIERFAQEYGRAEGGRLKGMASDAAGENGVAEALADFVRRFVDKKGD